MQGGQGGCAGEGARLHQSCHHVVPIKQSQRQASSSLPGATLSSAICFLVARLREELGRLSSLGVRVGAGGASARYTLRWGGQVAHDGNCLFEAVAAALGTGEPAASVRVSEHSAERHMFQDVPVVLGAGLAASDAIAGGMLCSQLWAARRAGAGAVRCAVPGAAGGRGPAARHRPDHPQPVLVRPSCILQSGQMHVVSTLGNRDLCFFKRPAMQGQAQDCQLTDAPCARSPDLAAGWAVNFIQEHKLLVPAAALERAETLVAAREATGTPYNEAAEAVRAGPPVGLLDNNRATGAVESPADCMALLLPLYMCPPHAPSACIEKAMP